LAEISKVFFPISPLEKNDAHVMDSFVCQSFVCLFVCLTFVEVPGISLQVMFSGLVFLRGLNGFVGLWMETFLDGLFDWQCGRQVAREVTVRLLNPINRLNLSAI